MEETMSADKKHQKPRKEDQAWPYTRVNAYLALAAMITLIAGYVALGVKPWTSWVSMNVAPVLLVIGYCVLVPAAIIYHKRDPKPVEQTAHQQTEVPKV
jgi:cytochrome c oxidase assembly factor CtaG